VALVFGADLCKVIEQKRMAEKARVGLPGERPPADCVVLHLALLSWYGRLPRPPMVSEQVIGFIFSQPVYAEGRCRFSASLEYDGRTVDLGVNEGTSISRVSRKATISKEGNRASAAAADKAMTQFLQALEKHFSR